MSNKSEKARETPNANEMMLAIEEADRALKSSKSLRRNTNRELKIARLNEKLERSLSDLPLMETNEAAINKDEAANKMISSSQDSARSVGKRPGRSTSKFDQVVVKKQTSSQDPNVLVSTETNNNNNNTIRLTSSGKKSQLSEQRLKLSKMGRQDLENVLKNSKNTYEYFKTLTDKKEEENSVKKRSRSFDSNENAGDELLKSHKLNNINNDLLVSKSAKNPKRTQMKMNEANRVNLDYNDEEECLSLKLDQDKSSRDFFNNVEKQSVARGSRSRSISPINISFSLGDDESVEENTESKSVQQKFKYNRILLIVNSKKTSRSLLWNLIIYLNELMEESVPKELCIYDICNNKADDDGETPPNIEQFLKKQPKKNPQQQRQLESIQFVQAFNASFPLANKLIISFVSTDGEDVDVNKYEQDLLQCNLNDVNYVCLQAFHSLPHALFYHYYFSHRPRANFMECHCFSSDKRNSIYATALSKEFFADMKCLLVKLTSDVIFKGLNFGLPSMLGNLLQPNIDSTSSFKSLQSLKESVEGALSHQEDGIEIDSNRLADVILSETSTAFSYLIKS